MQDAFPIRQLRERLGYNQVEFGALLGISSKGHVSELERTGKCSVPVALKLEELSDGDLDAASLNPDVALVRSSGDAA